MPQSDHQFDLFMLEDRAPDNASGACMVNTWIYLVRSLSSDWMIWNASKHQMLFYVDKATACMYTLDQGYLKIN